MEYTSADFIEKFKKDHSDVNDSDQKELSAALDKYHDDTVKLLEELRLKIGRDMRLDHVIFLFGNGASFYAGSKSTMDSFLQEYLNNKEFSDIKTELNCICSTSLNKEGKKETKGIEEQLNELITLKSYYNIIHDSIREGLVSDLINSVENRLISDVNAIRYKDLTWHKMLLRKLRYYGSLAKTQIYTTNYDLAFEYTMDELSIQYTDGFSGFVNRLFDPRTLLESGKPSLVKIHGSVNWVIREDRRIKAIQPKFKDGKVYIDDKNPALIYPTSNKLHETYSTPYSELMRHMLDEMESGSNAVIVMGYKYGDDHVNEILYKALDNPNNIFYFFIHDDPDKCDFIGKMRELGRNIPNINILSGKVLASFDVFVKYILPAVDEKTDEEQVLNLLQKVLLKNE